MTTNVKVVVSGDFPYAVSAANSAAASATSASSSASSASQSSASATSAATSATNASNSATASASSATSSASSAAASASSATSSASSATAAANSAATALATLDTGKIYTSTTAGLAATTNGQYFTVPSSQDPEYLILYQNQTGVAAEIKRYPSTRALDPLQAKTDSFLAVKDPDGNLGINIQGPFSVDTAGGMATALRQTGKSNTWYWGIGDNNGNIVLGVDTKGRLVANFSLVTTYKTGGVYDYEINHVFEYGQSLSVGQAKPAISVTQRFDNLMFTRGMRPQYDYPGETDAQWYAGFVPAIEENSTVSAVLGETPCGGIGDMIKERILAEDNLSTSDIKYQIALSCPGYGAQTIAQLSKGTTHYARMTTQATYGASIAASLNKSYAVQAIAWTQGESDYTSNTSRATYAASLNTLVTNTNTDIKAITGQTKNIPLISYQVASHKVASRTTPSIALAQLDVEASNSLVYIATPMYHFTYQSTSDFHLDAFSSRWMGAYYGLAYKRIVIDGIDWKPLKPISSTKSGANLFVKFHVPSGKLVFDTDNVTLNTNYGFELVDSGGSPLTISSVYITGPDTVKVVAASTIPTGAYLRYAWSGVDNVGPVSGPRGNLRDTQGDSIVFDVGGGSKPMHNWCVIFELGV